MKISHCSSLIFRSLIALACSVTLPVAHAEKADLDKPTNVEANQMFYDEAKQTSTFIGNVVLTRGTLLMKAEKMVVRQDSAGHQFATLYAATGSQTSFRQKRDGGKDLWIEGYAAERIEYDTKDEIAKLFSQAKIKMLEGQRPTDEVEGEFISYDSKTEFYKVTNTAGGDSKPGGGRIRAVIQPRNGDKNKDAK